MARLDVHVYPGEGAHGTILYRNPIPLLENKTFMTPIKKRLRWHLITSVNINNFKEQADAPTLFVDDYADNEKYRGLGIATSFFQKLRECAIKMGFRLIYAYNTTDRTQRFFTKKLGWTPLGHTKPEIIKLIPYAKTQSFKSMNIDFLSPKDKDELVLNNPNPEEQIRIWASFI